MTEELIKNVVVNAGEAGFLAVMLMLVFRFVERHVWPVLVKSMDRTSELLVKTAELLEEITKRLDDLERRTTEHERRLNELESKTRTTRRKK